MVDVAQGMTPSKRRNRQIRRRRKSVLALAGASRDVVAGACCTIVCATLGGAVFGVGSIIKAARRKIGPTMRSKESLIYEGMIMGGLLVAIAPYAWSVSRAGDAQHVTHKLLGLKPPSAKRRTPKSSAAKPHP